MKKIFILLLLLTGFISFSQSDSLKYFWINSDYDKVINIDTIRENYINERKSEIKEILFFKNNDN